MSLRRFIIEGGSRLSTQRLLANPERPPLTVEAASSPQLREAFGREEIDYFVSKLTEKDRNALPPRWKMMKEMTADFLGHDEMDACIVRREWTPFWQPMLCLGFWQVSSHYEETDWKRQHKWGAHVADEFVPVYEDVEIGPDNKVHTASTANVFLHTKGDQRIPMHVTANLRGDMFSDPSISVEVHRDHKTIAEAFLRDVDTWVRDANIYKDKLLTFTGGRGGRLSFLQVPPCSWDDVILPGKIIKQIRRATVDMLKRRDKFYDVGLGVRRSILLDGPPGVGKAQPLDAQVLTPEGYVQMGSIKKGTNICTPDGAVRRVTDVFPQGELDIYRVIFTDGTSTECCLDHLWYTRTKLDRGAKREGSVRTLAEIKETLRYGEHRNHKIPLVQPQIDFNSHKQLPIDPYLLGLFLGDGGLSSEKIAFFHSADSELVEAVNTRLAEFGCVLRQKKDSLYDYYVRKEEIVGQPKANRFLDAFRGLELMERRAEDKHVPAQFLWTTVTNRIALLQGLMDTDGGVQEGKQNVEFSSVSKNLADGVKFLIESLGGYASEGEKETTYVYKGERRQGQTAYRVWGRLPEGINPFRLRRKAEMYEAAGEKTVFRGRFIDSVEFVGRKPAQCIKIDHPDELYITNNFIVTHNTQTNRALSNEVYANAETQATIIWVSTKSIESAKDVKGLYTAARVCAPTLLLLEDVDLIGASRGYRHDNYLLGELLTQMDGAEDNRGLITVATTNDLAKIDYALTKRPGRFDRVMRVPLPSAEARGVMLKRFADARKAVFAKDIRAADPNDPGMTKWTQILEATEGMTGAYLQELINTAVIEAINNDQMKGGKPVLRAADLLEALDLINESFNASPRDLHTNKLKSKEGPAQHLLEEELDDETVPSEASFKLLSAGWVDLTRSQKVAAVGRRLRAAMLYTPADEHF